MQPAALDRSALDSLFSHASHWPSDGDWNRGLRDVAEHLSEHLCEHPKTGMLMVLVPAGKFLTATGGTPFEVDLPAFYVAMHPVTNGQYALFVAETGHRPPGSLGWQEHGSTNYPVKSVSWDDAMAYCRWAELRLPTELEWEKAARGLDGRDYPWGRNWDPNRCRNNGNRGDETTADVWRYAHGGAPFGGLQLSGNVVEWCSDWDDDNTYRYRHGNLTPPSSGQYRVQRGGSWSNVQPDFFSASSRRLRSFPGNRDSNYGFRCALGLGASP
jgi:formylglycine-generating enzyme required for sulfatase activity